MFEIMNQNVKIVVTMVQYCLTRYTPIGVVLFEPSVAICFTTCVHFLIQGLTAGGS